MRALVLEDDKNRVKEFKQRMLEIGCVADYVDTARAAIDLLRKKTYDVIFLDHDLGGEVFADITDSNTGSEVARWISGNPVGCPVVIHSLNPVGADNMKKCIEGAVHVPFVWQEDKFHATVKPG